MVDVFEEQRESFIEYILEWDNNEDGMQSSYADGLKQLLNESCINPKNQALDFIEQLYKIGILNQFIQDYKSKSNEL